MRFNHRSSFITALTAAAIACAGFSTAATAASAEQDMSPASAYRFQQINYGTPYENNAEPSAAPAVTPAEQGTKRPHSEYRFAGHGFSGSQPSNSTVNDHGVAPGMADITARKIGRDASFTE